MSKDNLSRGGSNGPLPSRSPQQSSNGATSQTSCHGVGHSSSCSPCPLVLQEEHRRKVETLRVALEAERQRSQEAWRHSAIQAQELHEAAERDRQLLVGQLCSRWEQQRTRELLQLREETRRQREAEIRQLLRWKEAELRESQELLQQERDMAMRQARDLQRQLVEVLVSHGCEHGKGRSAGELGSKCHTKLQEALGKLHWEADADQAAQIRQLRAKLELERGLFLKYILERFERDPSSPLGSLQRFRQTSLQQPLGRARAVSLESLISACTPNAGAVSKICFLNSNRRCESPSHPPLVERRSPGNCSCVEKHYKTTSGKEFYGEVKSKRGSCVDSPPEGKRGSCGAAREGAEEVLQQQGWMSGQSYNQLVKENVNLMHALTDLKQRYNHLKEENALLRRSSFPKMQEKAKWLKKKSAELAVTAKQLDERAQKLQESHLRVHSTTMSLALNCSETDFCEKMLTQRQAEDLNEQASVLLAKDQQLEALQEGLQAKSSAGKRSNILLNIAEFNRLLRESQKEVFRLQRQIALKSLRKSLQISATASNLSSSSVIMHEASLTEKVSLQDSPLAKETLKTFVILKKDAESEALLLGNEAKNYKNGNLKTDSKREYHLPLLEKQLVAKLKECENLSHEVEEKQRRCDEAELKLNRIFRENVVISEENSQLHGKIKWAEKTENENAQLKLKLIQAIDERDSAIQLARGLEVKVENLLQEIKNMKERAERREQLELQHEKTVVKLQKKEEISQLQQVQPERNREHKETGQLLEAQMKGIKNLHHSQTEHYNLLSQGLEALEMKISGLLGTERSPTTTCNSTKRSCPVKRGQVPSRALHGRNNITEEDCASGPPADLIPKAKELDSCLNSPSGPESLQNHSNSCLNPQEDMTGEMGDLGTDNISINLPSENKGPSKLCAFLARYSYDSFDGSKKNAEKELPLTAGEYVYIYGQMDKDGFYEGELMDGRRGLVPSNLVEEAAGNEQINFIRSQPSDISDDSSHETTSPCPSSTSGEKKNSSDEEVCVNLLSTGAEGRSSQVQEVPSPSVGPPDAPLDVQVQLGSSPEILVISWLPVTIDAAGSSNGVRVTGYAIYISGRKVMEIMSPTAGSVPLEVSQISVFRGPLKVSVRTLSAFGESEDSMPALIPSTVRKALGTLLSKFVASGWTFQEFLETECRPVPAPPCRFPPHVSCMREPREQIEHFQ